MKNVDLALLENVGDYACKLIAAHPALCFFGQDLSQEDLSQLTADVQAESHAGKPVCPPAKFISEVKRVVPQETWRRLTALLDEWSNESNSQSESRLNLKEHEHLTMGLLWQTLLITECKWRHIEIQNRFAAIEAAT